MLQNQKYLKIICTVSICHYFHPFRIVLILFFFAFLHTTFPQDYYYEVSTVPLKGELSNFSGQWFLQDSEGFIWFGSRDGLYRYDGSGFRIFRNDPFDTTTISNNVIESMVEDDSGNIWIGTKRGLNRYSKHAESFERFMAQPNKSNSLFSNNIKQVLLDRNGILWIAHYDGLSRFDYSTKQFRNYLIERNEADVRKRYHTVQSIAYDTAGYIWMDVERIIYRLNLSSDSIEFIGDKWNEPIIRDVSNNYKLAPWGIYPEHFQKEEYPELYINSKILDFPDNTFIRTVMKDSQDNTWIRTDKGIYGFNRNRENIFLKVHDHDYCTTPEYYFSYFFMEDHHGAIWYYTNTGIHSISRKLKYFKVADPDPTTQSYIHDICEENKNVFWVASLNGIYRFNPEQESFDLLYGDPGDEPSHQYAAECILKDSRGTLWIGMAHQGLFRITNSSGSTLDYTIIGGKNDAYSITRTRNLFEDSNHRIWVSFDKPGPCLYYDLSAQKFIKLEKPPYSQGELPQYLRITHELDSGILMATSRSGIYLIYPPFRQISDKNASPEKMIRCVFLDENDDRCEIPNPRITHIDKQGSIWLTSALGMVRLNRINPANLAEYRIRFYTTKDGLLSNNINDIDEDNNGNLWITTDLGLSRFNNQNSTFKNFNTNSGLPVKDARKLFKASNGKLYFGTYDGIVSFNPDDINHSLDSSDCPVYITDFMINGVSVKPGANSVLDRSIIYTDNIELKHHQHDLSFSFALLNYQNQGFNQYRYRMKGISDDWIYAKDRRFVNYTHLQPGRYTFSVTGTNNEGKWSKNLALLNIYIKPPPWFTWYAFLVYALILFFITIWIRRFRMNRFRLNKTIEREHLENEKAHEIDKLKSRFFTNISHEFRTPLTLIRGPLEDLSTQKTSTISMNRELLDIMRRSSSRLQNLINQLLDISKLETGNVKLCVTEGDLDTFIRTIILSFISLADSKNIKYKYDLSGSNLHLWYDEDKLEKILLNLVSNAFKFTPANGLIKIRSSYIYKENSEDPEFLEFSVSDTGIGIPSQNIDRIFDRFYQVNSSSKRETEGTGIGLALTKELVDLYRGHIAVKSKEGKGTTFTLHIPVSKTQFSQDELADQRPLKEVSPDPDLLHTDVNPLYTAIPDLVLPKNKPVILIVEDNPDLVRYISGNLNNAYNILKAKNGKEGMGKAIQTIPDLIISDLMMPVMNGLEMCRALKNNDKTSHIPIIMLTARADKKSKLEGLNTGADDYIVKPFDAKELNIRIKNLIEQRQRLWQKFKDDIKARDKNSAFIKTEDPLMKKLMDIFEQHYTDPDFNIDDMSNILNLSRAQLFRKINALAGVSPNELRRIYRIKKAAALIESGDSNISRIALEVGFKSASHFASSFKKYYGLNPSEYKDSF
ncbi:two-component regulator propeller domain-containing protein [Saccharicrinis sp. FJH62]|uniref:two-component regulator propeller domain-containing protein n=1 Tax=Saccharicrinis sp. FJH62 TaxID=3344657 RepID=UPI0035D4C58C